MQRPTGWGQPNTQAVNHAITAMKGHLGQKIIKFASTEMNNQALLQQISNQTEILERIQNIWNTPGKKSAMSSKNLDEDYRCKLKVYSGCPSEQIFNQLTGFFWLRFFDAKPSNRASIVATEAREKLMLDNMAFNNIIDTKFAKSIVDAQFAAAYPLRHPVQYYCTYNCKQHISLSIFFEKKWVVILLI